MTEVDYGPQAPSNNPIRRVTVMDGQLIIYHATGTTYCVPTTGRNYIPLGGGVPSTNPPPGGGTTPDPGSPPADDYPYATKPVGVASPFLFYYRECVDFCAWRVRTRTARTNFDNYYKGVRWGNANTWDNAALQVGIRYHTTPAVNSVAVRNTGTWGHVAWVYRVNADGTFNVEEYNYAVDHGYGIRDNLTSASGGFNGFIHFEDAP